MFSAASFKTKKIKKKLLPVNFIRTDPLWIILFTFNFLVNKVKLFHLVSTKLHISTLKWKYLIFLWQLCFLCDNFVILTFVSENRVKFGQFQYLIYTSFKSKKNTFYHALFTIFHYVKSQLFYFQERMWVPQRWQPMFLVVC